MKGGFRQIFMFYLRDLPDDKTLEEFAGRYPEIDPSAVKVCLHLLRRGSDLLAAFETMLSRHRLSQGRFLTLIVLYRTPAESINPSQLAEKIGVTRATMTGLLDGLEREGLVERKASTKDRREIGIRLTDKGFEVLEAMLPDYYRRVARLVRNLAPSEREKMITLLGRIDQCLDALSE
jgi:MarR family transcriptional regulator, negative regulator of the multidrug operon emrRAB